MSSLDLDSLWHEVSIAVTNVGADHNKSYTISRSDTIINVGWDEESNKIVVEVGGNDGEDRST